MDPTRKGPNEGAWYGDICMAGNTAYLVLGERSLARLAAITGDTAMAARREKRIEKAVKAKPLGVQDYCMSSTLVTMMLDGLTKKHKLKLRDKRPVP